MKATNLPVTVENGTARILRTEFRCRAKGVSDVNCIDICAERAAAMAAKHWTIFEPSFADKLDCTVLVKAPGAQKWRRIRVVAYTEKHWRVKA